MQFNGYKGFANTQDNCLNLINSINSNFNKPTADLNAEYSSDEDDKKKQTQKTKPKPHYCTHIQYTHILFAKIYKMQKKSMYPMMTLCKIIYTFNLHTYCTLFQT